MDMTIKGNAEYPMDRSLSINEQMNSRNTASFDLLTTNAIDVGQEVIIMDGATKIFGGTVDTFSQEWLRGKDTGNRKLYSVNCIDFNQLLDKGVKVAATYEDETVSNIINDTSNDRTIGSLLTAEGLTVGTISGGSVIIKRAVFNYISISDALDYIKDVTGLNWNVSYDKELDMFYRSDNVGALDSAEFYNITKEVTRQEYRNSQIVKAGKGRTATQTLEKPTPKPDGVSRTFVLRYPVAEKPRIFVDSVEVSQSDIGINGLDTNKKWYFTFNSKNITQEPNETVLDSTKVLEVTYIGLRDINVQATYDQGIIDRKAIETGTTGIYEEVEQRKELDSQNGAIDFANGLLAKFVDIPERVYISSSEYKTSGLIVSLAETKVNVDGEYLIESVSISEEGGLVTYNYNLASGEALGSWVEFFRKLANDSMDFTINENEVLVILTKYVELWKWAEELEAQIIIYETPANDLYYIAADPIYSGVGSSEVII